MVLAGLNRFGNDLKRHSVYEFDKRVYSSVFDNNGVQLRYLKECRVMFPMWVDHITKDILTKWENLPI